MQKTRLRDLSKTLARFRDPAKIFQDPRFSRCHSPSLGDNVAINILNKLFPMRWGGGGGTGG